MNTILSIIAAVICSPLSTSSYSYCPCEFKGTQFDGANYYLLKLIKWGPDAGIIEERLTTKEIYAFMSGYTAVPYDEEGHAMNIWNVKFRWGTVTVPNEHNMKTTQPWCWNKAKAIAIVTGKQT